MENNRKEIEYLVRGIPINYLYVVVKKNFSKNLTFQRAKLQINYICNQSDISKMRMNVKSYVTKDQGLLI